MKKLLLTGMIALLPAWILAQKMAENIYWISLTDKEHNEYSISEPSLFLSEKAIERRNRFNIPVTKDDLPVSGIYADSLAKLGLQIKGSSKWFNALLVESTDTLLLDSLESIGFVKSFTPSFQNFSESARKNTETYDVNFDAEFEYGQSYTQSNLLGGPGLHQMGYRGQGMDIAVLDGGFFQVDSFEAFRSLWDKEQISGLRDFVSPTGDIFNESTHGMSVLSTMAVSVPGLFIGTAPEASYFLLRSEEVSRENKVEEAYWVFAAEYADSAGADIITTSLGYHSFDNIGMDYHWEDLNGTSALVTRAAEFAFSRGILVIASAGNEGSSSWQKITPPADGPNVLAVGSVDTSLNVSRFSSRGFTSDGRIKPDVLAVGYETKLINRSGEPGIGYGTSFAAPQVAGLAACLWQAMPEKSNYQILEAIRKSSHLYLHPDSIHGYGVPNFMVALWFLNNLDQIEAGQGIHVFPNPFQENFQFISPIAFDRLSIYSLSGKQLFMLKGNWSKDELITVTPPGIWIPGMYFLVVQNENRQIVSRIIRQ